MPSDPGTHSQDGNDLEASLLVQEDKKAPSLLDYDSPHSVLVGMILFSFTTFFVAAMGTCAKLLESHGMPVFETVLARSAFMVVISSSMMFKSGIDPRGNRRWLLLLRSMLGFGSVSSIFWAVKFLPLGDATVLSFLAPLFVAITAPVLLKEAPSRMALLSLPICLAGVVLVAHPTFLFHGKSLSIVGIIIGMSQAFFSATAKMSVRALRTSEADAVIVFWMAAFCTIASGSACIFVPNHFRAPVGAREWLLLLGTGCAGFGNQICLTMGLRRAPATPAIAMSYLAVIWGLLFGFTCFGEVPTLLSLLGATLICGCTLLLTLWQGAAGAAQPSSTKVDEDEAAAPLLAGEYEEAEGLSEGEDLGARDGVALVTAPEGGDAALQEPVR